MFVREYDLDRKEFLSGPETFAVEFEAKTRISWLDQNSVSGTKPGARTLAVPPWAPRSRARSYT